MGYSITSTTDTTVIIWEVIFSLKKKTQSIFAKNRRQKLVHGYCDRHRSCGGRGLSPPDKARDLVKTTQQRAVLFNTKEVATGLARKR